MSTDPTPRALLEHAGCVRGGSYLSVSDPRFHFGLGGANQVDRLTVTWLDGSKTSLADVAVNRLRKITKPAKR